MIHWVDLLKKMQWVISHLFLTDFEMICFGQFRAAGHLGSGFVLKHLGETRLLRTSNSCKCRSFLKTGSTSHGTHGCPVKLLMFALRTAIVAIDFSNLQPPFDFRFLAAVPNFCHTCSSEEWRFAAAKFSPAPGWKPTAPRKAPVELALTARYPPKQKPKLHPCPFGWLTVNASLVQWLFG